MKNQKTIQIPSEFERLLDGDWREAAVYGGRFSLKSHTTARILLIRARQKKERIGCFREFQNAISESSHQLLSDLIELYDMKDFKVTDKSIVNTITGSDFLFKGLHHNEQSVKSIEGITIAWVEEAQTISEKSIEILTPTVREEGSQIIYTYNRLNEEDPVHKRLVIDGRPNTLIINANYDVALKYGWMPEVIKNEMEDDKQFRNKLYQYKWLGVPSGREGRIYRNWKLVDKLPHEARLVSVGMDFGYSNDPTAMIGIYKFNDGYILDEIGFQKGLSNKQIADIIRMYLIEEGKQAITIADSAEPKSIDEIRMYGVTIMPCKKGADSVRQGIQFVQELNISVTNRSKNLWTGYQNYYWKEDKEGSKLNVPDHKFSDALDAVRYGFDVIRPEELYEEYKAPVDMTSFRAE